MNCKQAEDLQLAVKYVLGELPPVQRDEYEDHYIDCPECAKDVYSAAAFTDTAREVFREEARDEAPARVRERGWFAWLRPLVAAPAMLVLLVIVGYQNLITVPRLKSAEKAQVFNSFSLVASNVRAERGDEVQRVPVQKNETFALDVDFLLTPEAKSKGFDHYLYQLRDETGGVVQQGSVPAEKVGQEVHVLVPGVDHAGKYSLVIAGDLGTKGEWVNANEVSRWNFVVDFRP